MNTILGCKSLVHLFLWFNSHTKLMSIGWYWIFVLDTSPADKFFIHLLCMLVVLVGSHRAFYVMHIFFGISSFGLVQVACFQCYILAISSPIGFECYHEFSMIWNSILQWEDTTPVVYIHMSVFTFSCMLRFIKYCVHHVSVFTVFRHRKIAYIFTKKYICTEKIWYVIRCLRRIKLPKVFFTPTLNWTINCSLQSSINCKSLERFN